MMVLVTGAGGQLGRCMEDAFDRVQGKQIQFVLLNRRELDITNREEIVKALDEYKPDVVVNCAAYVKTDNAEDNRTMAYMVNAVGPTYLAIECKERNVGLIHISTDYVYDGTKTTAYSESDKCNPLNIYGVSKYCGEQAIRSIYPDAYIIRTSWLYSEYGENFLTKTIDNIERAKDEGKNLYYVHDQIGCPTYAGNLADFIVDHLLLHWENAKHISNRTFHYTDAGVASRYDFAKAIEEEFGYESNYRRIFPCDSSDFEDKAKRPQCCILSKKRIRLIFDAELMDWRTALRLCKERYVKIIPWQKRWDIFGWEPKNGLSENYEQKKQD